MDEQIVNTRRKFLIVTLAGAGMLSIDPIRPVSATELLVANVTELYSVPVASIIRPSNSKEVSESTRSWPGKIAIGGGRYSMGGQTAVRNGLHLDMRGMNRLVWFKPEIRRIRVQAGMRWRDLQEIIDPRNLAVKTMQSYSNFTVGGSVSVNVHGRYIGNGPICNSIRALQIVVADGSILEASRTMKPDLFQAAIGGYGAMGVITEVELELAENVCIERIVQTVPLHQYPAFFKSSIEPDGNNVFHNADLIPPLFDSPIAVTWRATSKPLTEFRRMIPEGQSYSTEQNLIWALTELPGANSLHKSVVRPSLLEKHVVKWRNHEASLDVAELEPRTRSISTYVLQEYFIPIRHFASFAIGMATILKKNEVDALNVSVRHSPADTVSAMPWAKEEVFCFVLYYKQRTHRKAMEHVGNWTRELIDLALEHDGRYYLPYQLHATKQQFNRAYPEAKKFREFKRYIDPQSKFENELWRKYL